MRPLRRVLAAPAILPLALVVACAGPDAALTAGSPVRVALTPRFQAGVESARPISRVRIVARQWFPSGTATTEGPTTSPDTLAFTDARVNPGASEWRLSVAFAPPTDTIYVVATIELLHQPSSGPAVVEWSGLTEPIPVAGTTPGLVETVDLGRGPLQNLEVFDIVVNAARTAVEGDTVAATATAFPTTTPAAQVFWGSLDTAVATVTPAGRIATRRDGVARITATAGFAAETVTLQVLQRPTTITLAPDSLLLGPNAPTGTFTATVRDARGAVVTGGAAGLTWTSTDPNLVQSLGNGQFTTSGRVPGRTTIRATSVVAPGVTATAPVRVQ